MAEPVYEFILCDRNGAHISTIANPMDRMLKSDLNRPASASFRVSSLDPSVIGLHTDGYPFLSCGDRTLKVFRDGLIVFAGIVWLMTDSGDENACYTQVTAFDPYKMMFARLCRDPVTEDVDGVIKIANYGGNVIQNQINRTISTVGDCYIDTAGGFVETTAYFVGEYRQEYIGRLIADITDTGTCDVVFAPNDFEDGTGLVSLYCLSFFGADRSADVKFEYHVGAHQAQTWEREQNMDTMANWIRNATGDKKIAWIEENAASEARFGFYESASQYTDIFHADFLIALTKQELAERKRPREIVGVKPMNKPDSPRWYDDFDIGDLVTVECGSDAREAITGVQRIFGLDISIGNDGVERVDELRATANYGSG